MLFDWLIALAPAWPALGALVIAALLAIYGSPTERVISRVATGSLTLTLISVAAAIFRWAFLNGGLAFTIDFGDISGSDLGGTRLQFLVDGLSLPPAFISSILLLATCRFSAQYLHREPGFLRFFALMLVFGSGLMLLLLGGNLDLLFAGWELVGMSSVLLVAFFQERAEPVRAAIRVLVTYRICDMGLVIATVALHRVRHTTSLDTLSFPDLHHVGTSNAHQWLLELALMGMVLAAAGKSAQFPLGGWLPRAMEGPTASSAIFYGGLSVHVGVYLLARAFPLYESMFFVRATICVIGAVTAIMATLSGQASPDAKTSLAYATSTQIGIMFVECALGFPHLAIWHLTAHAVLRYYQFLRTPSVLSDALARRAAAGMVEQKTKQTVVAGPTAMPFRRFLYRLAIERFEVEAALSRWIARPALAVSRLVDRMERAWMGETGHERSRGQELEGNRHA